VDHLDSLLLIAVDFVFWELNFRREKVLYLAASDKFLPKLMIQKILDLIFSQL